MLNKILDFSIKNKLIVILFTITIVAFGLYAIYNIPVGAVPEESLVKADGSNYLLVLLKNENSNYFLKKIKVDIGQSSNGHVEILNQLDSPKILTKGAFNIKIE